MERRQRLVRYGFFAAAAYNIVGILVISRGLTNTVLHTTDPLFSAPACGVIMIWGLAYLSLAWHVEHAPYVALAFAIEKAFYAAWWARWMVLHSGELPALAERDAMAASFYGSYGLGDALFMLFFGWVFWTHRRKAHADVQQ